MTCRYCGSPIPLSHFGDCPVSENTPDIHESAIPPDNRLTLDTDECVFFYEQQHYYLSNFSSFMIALPVPEQGGPLWFPTVEHAYHWRKHPHDPLKQEAIRKAKSAHEAFQLGQRWKPYNCHEWDEIKVDWMVKLLRLKVQQHLYVRTKLLATGVKQLIENSWRDDYWGWGANRNGINMLGQCWMQIRDELVAGKL